MSLVVSVLVHARNIHLGIFHHGLKLIEFVTGRSQTANARVPASNACNAANSSSEDADVITFEYKEWTPMNEKFAIYERSYCHLDDGSRSTRK